jgi:dnd system-associated protein 4
LSARASAFEEYYNGGLEILREELRGAVNTLETVILLINSERKTSTAEVGSFDLSKLV